MEPNTNMVVSHKNGHFAIDLHTHSTASDGTLSPEALADLAAEKGFHAFALTDHDTVAGIAPADRGHRSGVALFVLLLPGFQSHRTPPGKDQTVLTGSEGAHRGTAPRSSYGSDRLDLSAQCTRVVSPLRLWYTRTTKMV